MTTPSQSAADAAIAQVAGSHAAWLATAVPLAITCLRRFGTGAKFTTDDLWQALSLRMDPPREPRAMGALMVRLRKLSVCEHTGQWSKSKRVACHARPLAIWVVLSAGVP